MRQIVPSLTAALQQSSVLLSTRTFTGIKLPDQNTPGRFLLVESDHIAYSFRSVDIETEEIIGGDRRRIRMRAACQGHVIRPFVVEDGPTLLVDETLSPPRFRRKAGDPKLATARDVVRMKKLTPDPRTLAMVAASWENSCALHDDEANDCAHFLSDAFIRAGYNELRKAGGQSQIEEWCDWNDASKSEEARPIRAKEMWEWFKVMSKTSRTSKPSKAGLWATFQWDRTYSGGHVLLYDSDTDVIYGTGAFWHWSSQNFYQW